MILATEIDIYSGLNKVLAAWKAAQPRGPWPHSIRGVWAWIGLGSLRF